MKICLWETGKGWELKDIKDVNDKELTKRNIVISDYAKIGDSAKIGNSATIGYSATIGNSATIGYYATIGDYAKIGNSATIGYYDVFSELSILAQMGIVFENGVATFYKAVQPDLTDFYTGKYQYKIGKGDRNSKLKQDQDVECGEGWHFTNIWNAIAFLEQREGVIIAADIKLKDILAVHTKVRVKAFSNVRVIKVYPQKAEK